MTIHSHYKCKRKKPIIHCPFERRSKHPSDKLNATKITLNRIDNIVVVVVSAFAHNTYIILMNWPLGMEFAAAHFVAAHFN